MPADSVFPPKLMPAMSPIGPDDPALVLGEVCLAGVLDQEYAVPVRDLPQRRHVADVPELVHPR